MKNLTKATILAASLLVSSAYANSNTEESYFGVGIARSGFNDESIIYKTNSYKALIGKRLDDNKAIELQYTNLAKAKLALNGTARITDIYYSGYSLGIAGLHYFSIQSSFLPFVKLGAHSWSWTLESSSVARKRNGISLFYGIGIEGKINETMKYRAEYEILKEKGDDLNNIGVALLVNF